MMRQISFRTCVVQERLLRGSALIAMLAGLLLAAGCEVYSASSSSERETDPNAARSETGQQAGTTVASATPVPQAAREAGPGSEPAPTPSPAPQPAPQPAPEPAPAPEPPPAPEQGGPTVSHRRILWEPRESSVRIVIPNSMPHWQLYLATTTPAVNHVRGLYGPDRSRGRVVEGGFEYILSGSGAEWRQRALDIDPGGGGAIVVFINTTQVQPNGQTATHWVVPNPTRVYTGSN